MSVARAKRIAPPPLVHRPEHRACACGCGRHFRPTATVSGASTEHFIDAFHAYAHLAKRMKWARLVATPRRGRAPDDARPVRRARADGVTQRALFQSLPHTGVNGVSRSEVLGGPMVQIGPDLDTRDGKRLVRLGCGHTKWINLTTYKTRCGKCRDKEPLEHAPF